MMINILVSMGVLIIAILHLWFCILEMFFWKKPLGLKTFKTTPEFAQQSAKLAANQGLYNAFLSAGLVWGLLASGPESWHVKLFFLNCVAIAGIYGGITVSRKIILIQGFPAIITLIFLYISAL